eukprot:4936194-Prymnesium_polylepis.1
MERRRSLSRDQTPEQDSIIGDVFQGAAALVGMTLAVYLLVMNNSESLVCFGGAVCLEYWGVWMACPSSFWSFVAVCIRSRTHLVYDLQRLVSLGSLGSFALLAWRLHQTGDIYHGCLSLTMQAQTALGVYCNTVRVAHGNGMDLGQDFLVGCSEGWLRRHPQQGHSVQRVRLFQRADAAERTLRVASILSTNAPESDRGSCPEVVAWTRCRTRPWTTTMLIG